MEKSLKRCNRNGGRGWAPIYHCFTIVPSKTAVTRYHDCYGGQFGIVDWLREWHIWEIYVKY